MKEKIFLIGALLILVSITGEETAFCGRYDDLFQQVGCQRVDFEVYEIGERIVLFQQRRIGDVIVEKDYINYQFDAETRSLVKETVRHRDDLPESYAERFVNIDEQEAERIAGGDCLRARLMYISPDSDVYRIDPAPTNPCWIIRRGSAECGTEIIVIDASTGDFLGKGIPPPDNGFSSSGPIYYNPCSTSWTSWYYSADYWFENMGYPTDTEQWPTKTVISSYIQDDEVSLFYEIGHGGSYYYGGGCSGGNIQWTYASDIETWIAGHRKMPFTFIASCDGMCSTGSGTLSHAFRQGSNEDCSTVGYCGMSRQECDSCWDYSVVWQNALFSYMAQGYTVSAAFDQAMADYPVCAGTADCMRFAGDPDFALEIIATTTPTASPTPVYSFTPSSTPTQPADWYLYGEGMLEMYDDGSHGDEYAFDGIYSAEIVRYYAYPLSYYAQNYDGSEKYPDCGYCMSVCCTSESYQTVKFRLDTGSHADDFLPASMRLYDDGDICWDSLYAVGDWQSEAGSNDWTVDDPLTQMFDDGPDGGHGDREAGDAIFSRLISINIPGEYQFLAWGSGNPTAVVGYSANGKYDRSYSEEIDPFQFAVAHPGQKALFETDTAHNAVRVTIVEPAIPAVQKSGKVILLVAAGFFIMVSISRRYLKEQRGRQLS